MDPHREVPLVFECWELLAQASRHLRLAEGGRLPGGPRLRVPAQGAQPAGRSAGLCRGTGAAARGVRGGLQRLLRRSLARQRRPSPVYRSRGRRPRHGGVVRVLRHGALAASARPDRGRPCLAVLFARSTFSPPRRIAAIRSRSCSTRRVCRRPRCSALRTGRTCPRRRSSCRRRPRRRLPPADLHADASSCRSPGIRRSARATPGSGPRGRRATRRRAAVRRGPDPVRRTPDGLAFAAPPLVRSGPVEEPLVEHVAALLGIGRADIQAAEWVDNGPGGWPCCSRARTRSSPCGPASSIWTSAWSAPIRPGRPARSRCARSFPKDGSTAEDPVTGSLNASLAQWLLGSGRASAPYIASQGTVLGRAGRVHISRDADANGSIWVGGGTVTCVSGQVEL